MSAATLGTAIQDATQHYRLLYGDDAPGYVPIFLIPTERTLWVSASDPVLAAETTVAHADNHDVYYGVGLHPKALDEYHRGEASDVSAMPGVYLDADFGTDGHKKAGLPPTRVDAETLIRDFPLPPTMTIFSGHGLQAYWLFTELWTFESNEERASAQDLAYRFNATMIEKGRARGWTVDSTHSLAQVLRPLGTWNRKGEPVPVELVELDETARYSRDDFEPYLLDVEFARDNRAAVESIALPADLPKVDVGELKIGDVLRDVIRKGPEADPDWYASRSEAQWRILRELTAAGYDDVTIAGVFFDPQNVIGEKARQKGRKWFAADLARAKGKPRPPTMILRPATATVPFRTTSEPSTNGKVHDAGEPPAAVAEPEPETDRAPIRRPTTDLGNSERYIDRFGVELLYCKLWGDWLYWDGRRWKVDSISRPIALGKLVVRGIYDEAGAAETKEERRALATWAAKSEAEVRINAMVSLARSSVPAEPHQFDTDPWLLNVRNGTADTRTGELREHRSADSITKLIDIAYDPSAECPLWQAFLERVLPDEDVRRFVQRAAGYSATGSARERCVLIPYGPGKNGKGVFLQTLRLVLGEYAVRTPSETFLAKRSDGIPNDIAQLRGARFVFASETNEGRRLAEATIKDLTGGEDISARFMRGEWFSFAPTFTPWLATNHRPVIRGSDPAIWDRIRLIPFAVRIPDAEQDPELTNKLKAEYPGILAWIIRGAVDWYANGLGTPKAVHDATHDYQSEMDLLGAFIDDNCVIDPQAWALAGALYKAYCTWSADSGERALTSTAFGLRLVERGFTRTRLGPKQARTYSGLRMFGPDEGPKTGSDSKTGSDAVSGLNSHRNRSRVDDSENLSEPVYGDNLSDDDGEYATASPRPDRESSCWKCKENIVATAHNHQCEECGWLVCACGACGPNCAESSFR